MKHSPLARVSRLLLVIFTVFSLASCSQQTLEPPDKPPETQPEEPVEQPVDSTVTVAAAGDISCVPGMEPTRATCRMSDTADLVSQADPDGVLVLGDAQYEEGTLQGFRQSYDLNWGRFLDITHPVPGNHEYKTPGAAGYFAYFGDRAGEPGRSWYAFDLGEWRLYALDSNCKVVKGGCGPGSPQYEWLKQDLEESAARCTLAFWHHPRFSSSNHGDAPEMADLWELLNVFGTELVLAGHDHSYERFAPLAATGEPASDGIRQFVVGTGGRHLYEIEDAREGSVVNYDDTFGILVLELEEDGYRWLFMATEGEASRDEGEDQCR